jgi:hypothetical protein
MWYQNWLHGPGQEAGFAAGAQFELALSYFSTQAVALTTLKRNLAGGLASADVANSAFVRLSTQWAALHDNLQTVEGRVADASTGNLGSVLTALKIAAAREEWAEMKATCSGIRESMGSFNWAPDGDPG